MNKILILLLVVGYGIAGTEDYNYKCEKAQQHNKKETRTKVVSAGVDGCGLLFGLSPQNNILVMRTSIMYLYIYCSFLRLYIY